MIQDKADFHLLATSTSCILVAKFMATVASVAGLMTKSGGGHRNAALDGWRGIAISMVIVEHLQWSFAGHPLAKWTETGQHGVTIFFVLSGYLITSTLLDRPRDLKSFYVRRLFRLMPAAWLYLAVILLLTWTSGVRLITTKALLACLLFYRNYFSTGVPTQHFWSLSLEEQFYLVWPAVLFLCGARRAKWVAISIAVGVTIWRVSNWTWYDRYPFCFRTEVRADALLIGCTLALLLREPKSREWAIRLSRALLLPALGIVIACIALFPHLPPVFEDLSIAALIATSVLHGHALPSRCLAWRPLAWLGKVSYSLYLWQGLLALGGWSWRGSCAILLIAVASFYLVEQPFKNFGSRLLQYHGGA